MKSVCVVTGTRAEFGLLKPLIALIHKSPMLDLQLVVTGMHLSPEFGMTVSEIEGSGFVIARRIEMLLSSDSPAAVTKSVGLGLIGFADALAELRPDLLILLGDRFEILSAATAAMVARVPIAHIHGGEATEGLIDEAIRHSITKMSHIHFVATEAYRRRVIQLGEQPDHVFTVGALGIDNLREENFLEVELLSEELEIDFQDLTILVTFHPVTLEQNSSGAHIAELLAALSEFSRATIIFTMPNADSDGRIIIERINEYVSAHQHSYAFSSLGSSRYLSCVRVADVVVGNSSSGIIEVPALGKPTVNIGDRQRGRIRGSSVIDCEPERDAIVAAIRKATTKEFSEHAKVAVNPYGSGGASRAVLEQLENLNFAELIKKQFFDIAL